jgi:hypothetical protein
MQLRPQQSTNTVFYGNVPNPNGIDLKPGMDKPIREDIATLKHRRRILSVSEVKRQINIQKVVDFYKEVLGISLRNSDIDMHLIVLTDDDYAREFDDPSLGNFDAVTGDISLRISKNTNYEVMLAHEIVHLLSYSNSYLIPEYFKESDTISLDIVESTAGFMTKSKESIIGNFFEEGLAYWVGINFGYYLAGSFSNINREVFSGYYHSFNSLVWAIRMIANGDPDFLEYIKTLTDPLGLDLADKNWVVKLMFRAKMNPEVEQVFRRIINKVFEPLPSFYDELMLLGQSYNSNREDLVEKDREKQEVLFEIIQRLFGKMNPEDYPLQSFDEAVSPLWEKFKNIKLNPRERADSESSSSASSMPIT